MAFILNLTKRIKPNMPTPPAVRHVRNGVTIDPPLTPVAEPSRWWCFFGVHKYEIVSKSKWTESNEYGKEIAYGPLYVSRCVVCGKVKSQCL